MNVLRGATRFLDHTAVVAEQQQSRYKDIVANAIGLSKSLQKTHGSQDSKAGKSNGPRIAFLAPPGPEYVEAMLGSWLAGGIAVPLCLTHPEKELQYVVENCQASALMASPCNFERLRSIASKQSLNIHTLQRQSSSNGGNDNVEQCTEAVERLNQDNGSLIIYTSGTTGKPKGALHTFRSLDAQIGVLCDSWGWQSNDRILHTLPLHHIHGIVNALLCPLAVGATVEFQPKFSPNHAWQALKRKSDSVTVFMGVPTMYNYLLNDFDKMGSAEQTEAKEAAQRLRLTVSGSAACPVPIMSRWKELSGQTLLERYGMTETGMILSNPYEGERKPGAVGLPLPGVEVKLVNEGELAVKGNNVFKEYWQKPDATSESFTEDGFFLTGDTASKDKDGYWKILGRTSTDIIKSGGYKLSALQIEDVLLDHPNVAECAVIGVPDESMGEAVTAIISCKDDQVSLEDLRQFAQDSLAKYQLPTDLMTMDEIPRNAMGKINKKALRKDLFPDKF